MNRTLVAIALAGALLLGPAQARAQSVDWAAEAGGGALGAAAFGTLGLLAGTGGMLVAGKLSSAPPIVGMVGGAAVGMVSGVVVPGAGLGADGTVGGASLGLLGGSALTGALWGAHLGRERPSGATIALLMLSTALLPLAGTVVGYNL